MGTWDDDPASALLVAVGEHNVGGDTGGGPDLNGDGVPEMIDYDDQGDIWADSSAPDGSRAPQRRIFSALRTANGRFNSNGLETMWSWARDADGKVTAVKLNDPSTGLCARLKFAPSRLRFEYCHGNGEGVEEDALEDAVEGDYDGDGFMDRLRFLRRPPVPPYSLGGFQVVMAAGNGSHYLPEIAAGGFPLCGQEWAARPDLRSIWSHSTGRAVVAVRPACGEGVQPGPWLEFAVANHH